MEWPSQELHPKGLLEICLVTFVIHGDGTDILWGRRGERPMRKRCPVSLGQWEGAANSLGKQDREANPRGHWDKTYLSRDNSGRVILLQFK